MENLKDVARRANLALLWGGIACLIISVAASIAIWMHPYAGPDVSTGFYMMLLPGGALGVVFCIWGLCEMKAEKKRSW